MLVIPYPLQIFNSFASATRKFLTKCVPAPPNKLRNFLENPLVILSFAENDETLAATIAGMMQGHNDSLRQTLSFPTLIQFLSRCGSSMSDLVLKRPVLLSITRLATLSTSMRIIYHPFVRPSAWLCSVLVPYCYWQQVTPRKHHGGLQKPMSCYDHKSPM